MQRSEGHMLKPRWRRPTIARRCPAVWSAEDEREMRAAVQRLGEDIRRAGGIEAWLDTRLEDWLAESSYCHVTAPRR